MGLVGRKKTRLQTLNLKGRNPTKLSDQQIEQLNDIGYVILGYTPDKKSYVKKKTMSDLTNSIIKQGVAIINDDSDIPGGDQTRLMKICELKGETGRAANLITGRLLATFPHLKAGIAAFLVSKAHGHEQQPHTDVESGFEKLEDSNTAALWGYVQDSKIPLSVVLTYRQAATLIVWPGSHKIVWSPNSEVAGFQEGVRVHVPPHSAIVFRQDLVHAGSAYTVNTLRLHFYLELKVDDFVRAPDTTQPMDEEYFRSPIE
jgi:hypothetical protein